MSITPLLILSDAPTSGTGLGRICKDLATRIAGNMPDTFRVATAGYGGVVSRHLPFHQYILEDCKDFIPLTLPEIWEDWAGNEKGYLLTIWDASRLAWLAHPKTQCEDIRLRNFLLEKPFQRWIYAPIDAEGPNGRLTFPIQQALLGFDRILAYGKWAADVVNCTLDRPDGMTEYLPHGINTSTFYERNRALCRKMFISITGACHLLSNFCERVKADELLIGIVATVQPRKNWHLAIETCSILAKTHKLRIWIKCDTLERSWSLSALLVDYGLIDNAIISLGDLKDEQMAQAFSACDVTLGIGDGEGFGFPIFESIACQTPCIHGNYAQAPQWMPSSYLVEPIAYRYEGMFLCKRPVFSAVHWAEKVEQILQNVPRSSIRLPDELDWNHLWPRWEEWLRKGIK